LKHTRQDLEKQITALQNDLATLSQLNTAALQEMLEQLFSGINTIMSKIVTNPSEGNLQQASEVLAQVMTILQMIMSKVQQMRAENQQWTSRANIASTEIAANKAQIDTLYMADTLKYEKFMSDVSKYATKILTAVSILGMLTGGALSIA